MTPTEEKHLEEIRNRAARFNFGKTLQIASDMRFLLDVIKNLQDEIEASKRKSA